MADYRQMAINAICQDWCDRDYCGECFYYGVKQAIDALKVLPPEDVQSATPMQWIPFAKRTPKHGQQILVCSSDGVMWMTAYNPINGLSGAWMPLPEPWKDGEQNG